MAVRKPPTSTPDMYRVMSQVAGLCEGMTRLCARRRQMLIRAAA